VQYRLQHCAIEAHFASNSISISSNGQFIPTSIYPGVPNVDQMSRGSGQVGYLAEHRFDNIWTVRQNLRYNDIDSSITTIYPTGASAKDPNSLARSAPSAARFSFRISACRPRFMRSRLAPA
jgi:hypothetical protein